LDSVVIVNVVIQDAKLRKRPCVIFKEDIKKAYDFVKWSFLCTMLGRLGFCTGWISWIKGYMESSTMSVLVNGSPIEEFCNQKSLRQADPMAFFLFLVIAEGLVGLTRIVVAKTLFVGSKVGGKDLCISLL